MNKNRDVVSQVVIEFKCIFRKRRRREVRDSWRNKSRFQFLGNSKGKIIYLPLFAYFSFLFRLVKNKRRKVSKRRGKKMAEMSVQKGIVFMIGKEE